MTAKYPEFPGQVCEVCGQPATNGVIDIQDMPSEGYGYKGYRTFGKPHFYCTLHNRESVEYDEFGKAKSD